MSSEEAERRLNDLMDECQRQRQSEQDPQRQDKPRKRDGNREAREELVSRAQ